MKENRCAADVTSALNSSKSRRCHRKPAKGSDYCPTHAPERVDLRNAIVEKRHELLVANNRKKDYALLFAMAYAVSADYREYAKKFKFYLDESNRLLNDLNKLTGGKL